MQIHSRINEKAKAEITGPSETKFLVFLLILGPFWDQNHSKKQRKTVSIFGRKKGSEKEGQKVVQKSSGTHRRTAEMQPGSHFFGIEGRWGVGGVTNKTTKGTIASDLTRRWAKGPANLI